MATARASGLRIEHAPCADGEHHTSYLLVPGEPGDVFAFPESNFRLTSAAHQAEVRRRLAERGLTLVFPE